MFSVPRAGLFTNAKELVSIEIEAGWASGPVWMARRILPPPPQSEFDPPSIQPVASRPTDYIIPATNK